jgi:hypothetical protein
VGFFGGLREDFLNLILVRFLAKHLVWFIDQSLRYFTESIVKDLWIYHQNFSLKFEVSLPDFREGTQREPQPLYFSALLLIRADLLQIEGWNFGDDSLGPQIINFALIIGNPLTLTQPSSQLAHVQVLSKFTVYPRKSGSRVWAYVVKRVVALFFWNSYTIIWHLYALIFADWKFFLTISGFFRAAKRKNKAVFRISLKMANLYEIFYVMKVIGKIYLGYFLNGRTVNFHLRLILEFSD